jgi:alanine dehydrogenase
MIQSTSDAPARPATLFLSGWEVDAAFSWPLAIAALKRAYAAAVPEEAFPPRSIAKGEGT